MQLLCYWIIFEKSHLVINSFSQLNKICWFNALWFPINHIYKSYRISQMCKFPITEVVEFLTKKWTLFRTIQFCFLFISIAIQLLDHTGNVIHLAKLMDYISVMASIRSYCWLYLSNKLMYLWKQEENRFTGNILSEWLFYAHSSWEQRTENKTKRKDIAFVCLLPQWIYVANSSFAFLESACWAANHTISFGKCV